MLMMRRMIMMIRAVTVTAVLVTMLAASNLCSLGRFMAQRM